MDATAHAHSAAHDAHAHDIQKHVRTYIVVFAALLALTVVTVGVSYIHLPITQAVILAMFVAIIKGSLVAAFFMHLISERKVIYWVLGICVFMLAVLMIVPALTDSEIQNVAEVDATGSAHLETHSSGH